MGTLYSIKVSRMGPFSGDFLRGGDIERNITYFVRYIGPILHASLHVYCMDQHSIERMRWVPPLDIIDILFTFTFYKTNKLKKIWLCNTRLFEPML